MTRTRRAYLGALGGATAFALAGCGSSKAYRRTYDAPTVSVPSKASDYLSDVSNFDGEAVDLTDRDAVTVNVGAKGNSGFNAYSPLAVVVSTGTTVVWDWTGQGQPHNVVAENGAFDSGASKIDESTTFEHTFSESGLFRYYCTPHKTMGMKGVVVVE